jgi:uncharacterized protein (TIGR00730 family)
MTEAHIERICVYCGSSPGTQASYCEQASVLGRLLAQKNIALIYGGASIGVMGALADATLAAGGSVTGIMPRFLARKEIAHAGLTRLIVVDSMHQRKLQMTEHADAFIALPGGMGTLEELFEILTWAQLGLHHKPCGLLNVAGYFDHLMQFLNHARKERFIKRAHRELILVDDNSERLVHRLARYHAPPTEKWLDLEQT